MTKCKPRVNLRNLCRDLKVIFFRGVVVPRGQYTPPRKGKLVYVDKFTRDAIQMWGVIP